MDWKKKDNREVLEIREAKGVPYLSFPGLESTGLVKQGFSTRLGGVSEGDFSSMNFSFTRGDQKEHVMENYRRIAQAMDVDESRMVLSYQTHTTNVKIVTEEDAGKGIIKDLDYRDIDGLITNVPGITLVTFYADCVPLYFLDPVRRTIGLSHSGWRGTVGHMGQVTIDEMAKAYGSRPEDMITAIGPSICQDCYEVGPEVAKAFYQCFARKYLDTILTEKSDGKYQLNLWEANRIVLIEAGVKPEHIYTTNICTHCNPDLFFSHRSTGDKRGNLSAFLCLK